jgi:peptidoglycan/xylan/chitin deacetylase (PgdA/CDA1 family)
MYHRVGEVGLDPWLLCVTPEHFAEQLEIMRKYGHPMSLQQLTMAHSNRRIPDRAIVVTFDDGYADNLHIAKPLLESYNIPATVFVTTGQLGQEREFWWDELERLLLKPGRLPDRLCLTTNSGTYEWELGEAASYDVHEYQQDCEQTPRLDEPGSRPLFYYSVWKVLQPLPEDERLKAIEDILAWARAEPFARSTHRVLLPAEVRALGQVGGLIEVGAHTVTHPFLSAHSYAFQQEEIIQSKTRLEEILGDPVKAFSYPFGNYTAETVAVVGKAGFACACSTVEDTVWHANDRFQLPRFKVHNWNGEEFEECLLHWFRT